MGKASESILIKATPKQCYDVIVDYAKYPDFLKDSKSVHILKKSGKTLDVEFHIGLIKDIKYSLKMTGTPSKKVSWKFISGDFMKDNNGEWILKEIEKGRTEATYNIEMKFGLLVPSSITDVLIGKHLPEMLKSFKKRIESLAKNKK